MLVSGLATNIRHGNTNLNRLKRTTSLVKVVRNQRKEIASCAFYRNVDGSFKIQAYGNDGSTFGKDGVKAIIKSDTSPYDSWIWGEVSESVEKYFKKFEGYPLPNEFVADVLEKNPEEIQPSSDGFHYKRKIGTNDDPTEKVIFGFKDQHFAELVMKNADYEMERHKFNMKLVESDGISPFDKKDISFEGACSFVNQLSDLYDEENWRQLTPGLSSLLSTSIHILENNLDRAKWVKVTLDDARYLKDHMSEITFIKNPF